MSKCNHEKVCVECVKAEIAALEEKLREAKSKLPNRDVVIIKEFVYPNITNVPYNPCHPYIYSGGNGGLVAGNNSGLNDNFSTRAIASTLL